MVSSEYCSLTTHRSVFLEFVIAQSVSCTAFSSIPRSLIHGEQVTVAYCIFSFSNMTFDDWLRVAKDVKRLYELADGFVILHGTDTMAYTSSALSFMFVNLRKPVVVTGAQIPVAEVRSDGRENLIGALIVAGSYDIPEVWSINKSINNQSGLRVLQQ